MTRRRRPANRKGPRSAEHRRFGSPHLLGPRSVCEASSSSSSLAITTTSVISQELDESEQKDTTSEEEGHAVAIEAVVIKREMAGNTSALSTTFRAISSSSLDGETTGLLQRANELQCQKKSEMNHIDEEQKYTTADVYELPRRSRRKRRTMDLLRLSEMSSSRNSMHKRKNVESKVQALLKTRPTAAMMAAARAKPVMKEEKRKLVATKRTKKTASKGNETPAGILSPVQDEKKKTPKKKRGRKARRSLESAYSFESQTEYVSKLINELYEEQEQDDREMYNISRDTVVTETRSCMWSQQIEKLNMEEFRRLMTYGEVSIESVATTILPLLNLDEDDVFFDLGCGTGKILVQVALQTPCKRATGIELMQNRVLEGHKALKRLKDRDIAVLHDKQIEIFRGDIFIPPEQARLMDATVVFINNVMFGPTLMLKVMELLKDMSNLRCVITLRKICERHGDLKCTRAGNFCIEYVHPPVEAEIDVSWADKTSVYLYESLDYKLWELRRELANDAHQPTR